MAECHFDTHTHTHEVKVSNWWLLRLVFSLSAFYERRDVAVAGVCGFAEQVLSSWPSRHAPWPVADVRIPNAISVHVLLDREFQDRVLNFCYFKALVMFGYFSGLPRMT